MIFLQPLALFGLAAAAIPAVLHLMARRVPPTVPFPAVRYIAETERVYSRRLKLRNLLLLLLRMSVIAFLVLAAARPVIRIGVGGSHPPTEVVLIVDNSLSSGAVVSGRKQLDYLVEQARVVLSELTPDDRLWLVLADGVPTRVGVAEAELLLDTLAPLPVRMDIGAAVRTAERVMGTGEFGQTEIVLLSDLQRSALSTGPRVTARIVAFIPPPPGLPANHGIDSARAEPEVWSPNGSVVVSVSGSGSNPVAVRLLVRGVETARAVAKGGDHVVLSVPLTPAGWSIV
ncbi:MAG: BatA domain-containing protein, partial [Gemmatimonadetes bacterium]|nr:BatA domain-containing protein [Gemmatimonadota bacterium]